MEIVLRGAMVVDPSQELHEKLDILVEDGRVSMLAEKIDTTGRIVEDLDGLIVTPGLIDMHTHLREPGQEAKETVLTGSRAAAAGGYTCIAAMPNTQPVCDDPERVRNIQALAVDASLIRIIPVGAVTLGSHGDALADIEGMAAQGICAVSDDGRGIQDAAMARKALQICAKLGIPLLEHCEDESLAADGQLHEGLIAMQMRQKAIPVRSETDMIARDISLAEETKSQLHIMHVSAAASVDIIKAAKRRGISVTAEVTPHHLLLTEKAVMDYHTHAKMKPPLRSQADRHALQAALADGTIDIVATDHAPHTTEEKNRDFASAPFGVIGLETAFGLLFTYLVIPGLISLDALVNCMSCRPAAIFGLAGGTLKPGSPADLAAFDPNKEILVDKRRFYSKGQNTPFHAWKISGVPVLTMVGGRVIMRNGNIN